MHDTIIHTNYNRCTVIFTPELQDNNQGSITRGVESFYFQSCLSGQEIEKVNVASQNHL